ncbi:hypothetical protein, partial [Ancylobacter sp. 3268]|uniref:hypothetical protein n=1 Tax=Ancylobacter sp. 3268 TaxID=2817752 RepID=UPI00286D3E16
SSGLCFFCAMAPSSKGPKAYFTEDHFPGSRPLRYQRPVGFIQAPHGTVGGIDRRHSRTVLVVYWQNPICRMRRLLDEWIEIRRENAIDLTGGHKAAKYLVPKTGSALGDRIVDILSTMPSLWIYRFEGFGIFRRIAVRRQQ